MWKTQTARVKTAVQSPLFIDLLAFQNEAFDYIIIDGDAISMTSDISIMAKHFDGIVMVLECGEGKI